MYPVFYDTEVHQRNDILLGTNRKSWGESTNIKKVMFTTNTTFIALHHFLIIILPEIIIQLSLIYHPIGVKLKSI